MAVHKQAVDWLNEHTDDKINIFAISMELWQIGDSPYAPKFQIISKPNDWAKAIKKSTTRSELSDRRLMQLEFWNQFKGFPFKTNMILFLVVVASALVFSVSSNNLLKLAFVIPLAVSTGMVIIPAMDFMFSFSETDLPPIVIPVVKSLPQLE